MENKEIQELKEKIEFLEKQIKDLKNKIINHRHDGHGYSTNI
ncbi:MAG: hypothetical protein WC438_02385 [Candidatus Pacearchaeota archaeon]